MQVLKSKIWFGLTLLLFCSFTAAGWYVLVEQIEDEADELAFGFVSGESFPMANEIDYIAPVPQRHAAMLDGVVTVADNYSNPGQRQYPTVAPQATVYSTAVVSQSSLDGLAVNLSSTIGAVSAQNQRSYSQSASEYQSSPVSASMTMPSLGRMYASAEHLNSSYSSQITSGAIADIEAGMAGDELCAMAMRRIGIAPPTVAPVGDILWPMLIMLLAYSLFLVRRRAKA